MQRWWCVPGRTLLGFALPVQKIFQDLDRDLPVSHILTLDQVIGKQTLDASFDATLLLIFALVSLLLAAVGLFGVISYLAAQRMTEIGVRIALGAQRNQVLTLIFRDGMQPALIGLAMGLVASAGMTRLIQSVLYETRPLDPEIFCVVALTLIAVAAAACLSRHGGPAGRSGGGSENGVKLALLQTLPRAVWRSLRSDRGDFEWFSVPTCAVSGSLSRDLIVPRRPRYFPIVRRSPNPSPTPVSFSRSP